MSEKTKRYAYSLERLLNSYRGIGTSKSTVIFARMCCCHCRESRLPQPICVTCLAGGLLRRRFPNALLVSNSLVETPSTPHNINNPLSSHLLRSTDSNSTSENFHYAPRICTQSNKANSSAPSAATLFAPPECRLPVDRKIYRRRRDMLLRSVSFHRQLDEPDQSPRSLLPLLKSVMLPLANLRPSRWPALDRGEAASLSRQNRQLEPCVVGDLSNQPKNRPRTKI